MALEPNKRVLLETDAQGRLQISEPGGTREALSAYLDAPTGSGKSPVAPVILADVQWCRTKSRFDAGVKVC